MHNKLRCVNVPHSYLPNVVVIQSASWSRRYARGRGTAASRHGATDSNLPVSTPEGLKSTYNRLRCVGVAHSSLPIFVVRHSAL